MTTRNSITAIENLDDELVHLKKAKNLEVPEKGWLREVRTLFNIPVSVIAKNMEPSTSPQAVIELEKSEESKTITGLCCLKSPFIKLFV